MGWLVSWGERHQRLLNIGSNMAWLAMLGTITSTLFVDEPPWWMIPAVIGIAGLGLAAMLLDAQVFLARIKKILAERPGGPDR